jgi:hypothetical protein
VDPSDWKPRGLECPSDLVLDELVAGELDGDARQAAEGHVAACARCRDEVAARTSGFARHPEADPRRMLAAIRRGLDERPPSSRRWRWLMGVVPAAAAAAVVLVVALRPSPPRIRAKGGAILHVFRLDGDHAAELVSGERVRPGDRLRFAVDLPAPGHVSVVGVQADGKLYRAWPLDDGVPTARAAGRGQALPGAVALDDSPGHETLYLVVCGGEPSCSSAGAGHAPDCGLGCALSPFVLGKP